MVDQIDPLYMQITVICRQMHQSVQPPMYSIPFHRHRRARNKTTDESSLNWIVFNPSWIQKHLSAYHLKLCTHISILYLNIIDFL